MTDRLPHTQTQTPLKIFLKENTDVLITNLNAHWINGFLSFNYLAPPQLPSLFYFSFIHRTLPAPGGSWLLTQTVSYEGGTLTRSPSE